MTSLNSKTYTAFSGFRMIAHGVIEEVARVCKRHGDTPNGERLAVYDDVSGQVIELDLSGSLDDVLARLADHPLLISTGSVAQERKGPGRPRLGVVSREVSLLPRHWEWLAAQSGGASAALRRLVEQARKRNLGGERLRIGREALHRFLWDMAGNLPCFEEVSRALFADEYDAVAELIENWPADIKNYVEQRIEPLGMLKADAAQ